VTYRERYRSDPEFREREKARRRRYYDANAAVERDRMRARYWSDPETARERERARYHADIEASRERLRKRYVPRVRQARADRPPLLRPTASTKPKKRPEIRQKLSQASPCPYAIRELYRKAHPNSAIRRKFPNMKALERYDWSDVQKAMESLRTYDRTDQRKVMGFLRA
jgi:hypothetical protein